ncbi:AAA family ATPase [Rhizobium sp. C1]|uniref:ATP-binding protein n=1 Tax=Rhizobium sp. C1 TaxID=1349799 RepID=UPI003FA70974
MKISTLQITGFQSFRDSGEIEFSDGINLIVGQNNSGKSSLLRALQPILKDDRNRSVYQWENHNLPLPSSTLKLEIKGIEYKKILLRNIINVITVPSHENIDIYLSNTFSSGKIIAKIIKNANEGPRISLQDEKGN